MLLASANMCPLCLASVLLAARMHLVLACQPDYTLCQPTGATDTILPPVGTGLATLYTNLLGSVESIHAPADGVQDHGIGLVARDGPQICCADGTICLNLQQFNVPFCYDRFTTNFFLADGTTGTLDSGTLNLANGPQVNLASGNYNISGVSSNIYGTSSPPNAATMAIPSPYTAAGVGSAIPLSALAGIVTVTTTIPGTTVPPTTISASTFLSTETAPSETTISATASAITVPAKTVPPHTLTIATSRASATSSSSSSSDLGLMGLGLPGRFELLMVLAVGFIA